jgi:hypothetical protein
MPASPAALRFPSGRVLLPRTRLAYIHIRNLLTDAKRDRSARISGYVAISLLDELITLYLLRGEVANATIRDSRGARAVAIASALERIPGEPEYGEICFSEASEEQLSCMFDTHLSPPDSWPEGMATQDPAVLFPYLMSITFDGFVEIIAKDQVNYLIFANGTVARAYLSSAHHGTVVDRVAKLFSREGRISDLRIARWNPPSKLPVQAPPALVQAYRELSGSLVQRLVELGRETAPVLAEETRQKLVEAHPSLDGFSFDGRPTKEPLSETSALTAAVAAWIRDVIWAASDDESIAPDKLLRDLTWDRRHMFQSAGLFDQVPWKVM